MTYEELELAALCGFAWEQRGTDSFHEVVEAIIDWHDRRQIRAFERRRREIAALAQLLRDPRKAA